MRDFLKICFFFLIVSYVHRSVMYCTIVKKKKIDKKDLNQYLCKGGGRGRGFLGPIFLLLTFFLICTCCIFNYVAKSPKGETKSSNLSIRLLMLLLSQILQKSFHCKLHRQNQKEKEKKQQPPPPLLYSRLSIHFFENLKRSIFSTP